MRGECPLPPSHLLPSSPPCPPQASPDSEGPRGNHTPSCPFPWPLPPSALTSTVILREEECSPVLKEELPGLYVRHQCQIAVPNPRKDSQYTISIRPKEEEKFIKSSENSESDLQPLVQVLLQWSCHLCPPHPLRTPDGPLSMSVSVSKTQPSDQREPK